MNQKGFLTAWNDAKGLGFIAPEGGVALAGSHLALDRLFVGIVAIVQVSDHRSGLE
ncbi:hypothetical protein [Marinobacter sp. 2_MG-2023]|uniref:hypothetical protein n=1 Tax=Marinobacter sp. 2_MG-2023 TaxID=3062679 RepID=UPI0026E26DF7|nr:hypothetical protein [Marinobacter sp. 2_MG-2023]MDO6442861.1 hypothetical protein [Marinobacter sp. 2_MG-2023]